MACVDRARAVLVVALAVSCSEVLDIEEKPRSHAPACVADLATDSQNCGACGHACMGGACESGRCQPELLAESASDTGTGPGYLALDETTLYWSESESGQLRSIPKQGGTTKTLFTAEPGAYPAQLAVQGRVHFSVWGACCGASSWVGSVDPKTLDVSQLTEHVAGGAWAIHVRGTDLVWGNRLGPDAIMATQTSGGPRISLVDAPLEDCCEYNFAVIDGDWVYFTQLMNGRVGRVKLDGTGKEILAFEERSTALGIDAEAIYWSNAGALRRWDKATEQIVTLAQINATETAIDDQHVYFTVFSDSGLLGRVDKRVGGAVEVLVASLNGAVDVVLDDDFAYFSTQFDSRGGQLPAGVYRLRK